MPCMCSRTTFGVPGCNPLVAGEKPSFWVGLGAFFLLPEGWHSFSHETRNPCRSWERPERQSWIQRASLSFCLINSLLAPRGGLFGIPAGRACTLAHGGLRLVRKPRCCFDGEGAPPFPNPSIGRETALAFQIPGPKSWHFNALWCGAVNANALLEDAPKPLWRFQWVGKEWRKLVCLSVLSFFLSWFNALHLSSTRLRTSTAEGCVSAVVFLRNPDGQAQLGAKRHRPRTDSF